MSEPSIEAFAFDPHQGAHLEFLFSYDDSASTAAVELVKYQLGTGTLPEVGLGRPWEFLSHEEFVPASTEELGLFDVSFGLWERVPAGAETGSSSREYKLGVYVATPTISRSKNCVITLLVDESGSMSTQAVSTGGESETRMEILKAGLDAMLRESLIDGDVVNLVTFSTDATIVASGRTYPADRDMLLGSVAGFVPDGSTNLNKGLETAYEVAVGAYDDTKTNRVILLTDAWLNTGVTDVTTISEQARINESEKIYFSGVGISSDVNEAALNELTEAGRGAYFSCLTRNDAMRVFTEKFVALLDVAARGVRFRLDYPSSLTHAVTASEESSTVAEEVTPTNFSYNTSQYFFEGFTAEESAADTEAFTLTVTYTDPDIGEAQELVVEKQVGEMLGRDRSLIRDAEAVFLLAELVGDRMTVDEVNAILETHYTQYSSDLFAEYTGLIDAYAELSVGSVETAQPE